MQGSLGFHDPREEALEHVWTQLEEGDARLQPLLDLGNPEDMRSVLDAMEREGLLRMADGAVTLTGDGEAQARHVVRAHRLAARLLTDLLELPPESIDNLACRLEHAISPELADGLCTLLGHPPTAPNGRPIPRGRCCEKREQDAGPFVRQLPELDLGCSGRITFVHPRFSNRLEQLSALGIVPGTDIRLRQRHPSIVVEVGETTLALDGEVARDIYVKPLNSRGT